MDVCFNTRSRWWLITQNADDVIPCITQLMMMMITLLLRTLHTQKLHYTMNCGLLFSHNNKVLRTKLTHAKLIMMLDSIFEAINPLCYNKTPMNSMLQKNIKTSYSFFILYQSFQTNNKNTTAQPIQTQQDTILCQYFDKMMNYKTHANQSDVQLLQQIFYFCEHLHDSRIFPNQSCL